VLEDLRKRWPSVVEGVGVAHPVLQRILRDSWPVSLSATTLLIGFDPEFAGEIEIARQQERAGLRTLFQRVLGHPVHLDYTTLGEPVRWSHQSVKAAVAPAAGDEAFNADAAGLNPQAWLRNESIRQILEVFHGDVVEIQR